MSKATDTETRAFKARWKDAFDEFKANYAVSSVDPYYHAWAYNYFFEQGWKTCEQRLRRQAAGKGKRSKS